MVYLHVFILGEASINNLFQGKSLNGFPRHEHAHPLIAPRKAEVINSFRIQQAVKPKHHGDKAMPYDTVTKQPKK